MIALHRYIPTLFFSGLLSATLSAAPLNISNSPLFLTQAVPPLTLLVMGRDHKLYYEAYNDASDLDGDGILDIRFKPSLDYYGYFDPYKCYSYASGVFNPASITNNKQCSGSWSGNFLNYLTTSRIDAMRKVLYGGYRSTDSSTSTILERSHIPQDAHSWGKEYTSVAVDGYDISLYSPLSAPSGGNRHLFANTTILGGNGSPLLRLAQNQNYRIWEWVSIERPVAGDRVINGGNGPDISSSITDYVVKVKVCDNSVGLESNCQLYSNGNYKPVGLLQQFGENDSMKFGLLTGSYTKNLSGGVLRKNIASIGDEIDPSTGVLTSTVGIIRSIDRLMVTGFGSSYHYYDTCGWITTRDIINGECRMWGNPVGEMLYESLRYFAGKSLANLGFNYVAGDDTLLGLPKPVWQDPYSTNPRCAKPNILLISDINPSYDSDEVPGSDFNTVSGDLSPALDAAGLAQSIWTGEGYTTSSHFIGQSGSQDDGAPTAKTVTSFGNIRGLAPEEPNKQGSYYSASVAYYGWLNDINAADDKQQVYSYVIALASPLPEIRIPVNGSTITLIPFAKSAGGCLGINGTQGLFQPTNTIVDFYVESVASNTGTFRINFEDVQQGADHDMDAIVKYTYVVNGDNTVTITLDSTYAAGCIIQHMGYVISGTTADGAYLEVRDQDTSSGSDPDYFLDTPPGQGPGGTWADGVALPLTTSRTFTPSSGSAATLLKSPLYYVAKWGSFDDKNNNNKPDLAIEYDTDANGVPDNYFLVTNALNLVNQLTTAFNTILDRTGSFTSAALSSGVLNSETKIYQALYNTDNWQGQLLAFTIDVLTGDIITTGFGPLGSQWDAGALLKIKNFNTGRKIITHKPSSGIGIKFRWPQNPSNPTSSELDLAQITALNINPQTGLNDSAGQNRLNHLRGDNSNEQAQGGTLRDRETPLGDITTSTPILIPPPNFNYPIPWASGSAENSPSYQSFQQTHVNRTSMLVVGSNDGMLHIFDASSGEEILSYVPSTVFNNLNQLTSPDYSHYYYVDGSPNYGDVYFNSGWHTVLVGGLNGGGQGIYALDVTTTSALTEANAGSVALWEFDDIDDSDMGYSYSQPAIVRLANGQWAAVFGNGYNNTKADGTVSSTGNAVLFFVDIHTGTLIKKLDTGVGVAQDPTSAGRPNGLSTPVVIDINGDGIADYIYVGDLFGNLWKIDIQDSNTNQWDFSFKAGNTPLPLFIAQDASNNRQAITTRPIASRIDGEVGSLQIYFGTGKYIEVGDKTDLSIQTVYALRDDHSTTISGRSVLTQQSILQQSNGTRVTSETLLQSGSRGWYLDLIFDNTPAGERVISELIYLNQKIIFTTIIPTSDPCDYGGSGWLMELNAMSGGRLSFSAFDLNDDKKFTSADNVTYTDGGGNETSVPASGIQSTVGLIPSPAVLNDGNKEHKYLPGTTGGIQHVLENPGNNAHGRESWRQLK